MSGKAVFLWVMGMTALILLVTGCSSPQTSVQAAKAEIPLLDTEMPATVETATFALG